MTASSTVCTVQRVVFRTMVEAGCLALKANSKLKFDSLTPQTKTLPTPLYIITFSFHTISIADSM